MLIAWRNLFRDRLRLALSVAGVAVSVMLILLLRGYLDGIYRRASAYFEETPGVLIAAQRGTRNALGASSQLPPGAELSIRQTDGVAGVIPILLQNVILDLHGRKQFAFAVGYQPGVGGGPWSLSAGREPRASDEIVIDRLLADEHQIAVGDRVKVLGRQLTVVGTSDETTFWIGTYAFTTKDGLEALTRAPGVTSFIFVSAEPGIATDDLRLKLAHLTGVGVLTKEAIAENQRRVIGRI